MRKLSRIIFSAVALIALTLLTFTTELIAEQMGLVRLVQGGWRVVVDAGYDEFVFWATIFFCGGALALWIDWLLRVREHKNKAALSYPAQVSVLYVTFDPRDADPSGLSTEHLHNVEQYIFVHTGNNSVAQFEWTISVYFERPMKNVTMTLAHESERVEWQKCYLGKYGAAFGVRGDFPGQCMVLLSSQGDSAIELESWVWRDADPLPTEEQIKSFLSFLAPDQKRKAWWQVWKSLPWKV